MYLAINPKSQCNQSAAFTETEKNPTNDKNQNPYRHNLEISTQICTPLHQKKKKKTEGETTGKASRLPEIAMAKPHPPPQTSFQEFPPTEGGSRTGAGTRSGDLCGDDPGRYPHMKTTFSFPSSIFSSSSLTPPFMAASKRKKKKTEEERKTQFWSSTRTKIKIKIKGGFN